MSFYLFQHFACDDPVGKSKKGNIKYERERERERERETERQTDRQTNRQTVR